MSGIYKRLKKKTRALFHGANQAPQPSVAQTPSKNTDGGSDLQSSPLSHPINSKTVDQLPSSPPIVAGFIGAGETQSSSLPNYCDSADGQQPSSLSNVGNSTTHLPLPSPVTFHNRNYTVEHLRLPSRASFHDNNESTDHLRPDEALLHDNHRRSAQRSSSPRNDSSQTSVANLYHLQSQGDKSNRVNQISQFSAENANLYEFHGNQVIYYNGNTGPAVLERLAGCAMLDAIFDSSARDPPPRCHPGTRQDILRWAQQLLDDPQKKAQMTWFPGAAGVGKSAVMQTIAETEAENDALGASLFFSRPNNRDDPQKVFTTIAFQFATKQASYQQYLAEQMAADPSFLNKTMEKQFRDLIVIPFAQQQLLSGSRGHVVLLDGLDECKGTQEQRRIVKLIGDFISDYPAIPLRWIIASRPEQHLVLGFSEIKGALRSSFWEKEIPIDSEESVRDVELYLHNEFTRIRNHYPDLMATHEKWPSENQFLAISSAASGLFVFASTVIRFIDDDEDPIYQLTIVISVLQKQMKRQDLQINPLALLDAIYDRILSDISSRTLGTVKLILGYLIIRTNINKGNIPQEYKIPAQPFWICNMMDLEQHALYGALRKLRSVLSFPEPERASVEEVHFLHASFSDYLKDEKRSHVYYVNLDEAATYLWRRFMAISNQWMRIKSHHGVEYIWSMESLREVMKKQNAAMSKIPRNERLLECVRWCWLFLLKKHFDPDTDTTFRLLLPIEELMEQLNQLDYSYKWILPATAEYTNNLIECLEAHVPLNHRASLVQTIDPQEFDRTRLLLSTYTRPWDGSYMETLDPKTEEILKNDPKEFEKLVRAKSGAVSSALELIDGNPVSGFKMMALGARPSKCRILIQRSQRGPFCLPYFA